MIEKYRYAAERRDGSKAYGDYSTDAEAVADFTERFPDAETISIYDDDFKFWMQICPKT